jgi:hypothetical protein
MKILVSKKVKLAATEDAIYLEDMQRHPQKQITCRGKPFWSEHAAKKLLDKDLKDWIGENMKPKGLWMSRREYQYFPYNYFCKRAHEVRYKELAAPYWQVKRKKNGRSIHCLETNAVAAWRQRDGGGGGSVAVAVAAAATTTAVAVAVTAVAAPRRQLGRGGSGSLAAAARQHGSMAVAAR